MYRFVTGHNQLYGGVDILRKLLEARRVGPNETVFKVTAGRGTVLRVSRTQYAIQKSYQRFDAITSKNKKKKN